MISSHSWDEAGSTNIGLSKTGTRVMFLLFVLPIPHFYAQSETRNQNPETEAINVHPPRGIKVYCEAVTTPLWRLFAQLTFYFLPAPGHAALL